MIVAIVVIAKHRQHPIGGIKRRKAFHKRRGFSRRAVHQVAGEANQVGFLIINGLHQMMNKCGVGAQRAKMKIGELGYAIAVESGRQIAEFDFNLAHVDVEPGVASGIGG